MSNVKFISMGFNCSSRRFLERLNLVLEYTPFDWCLNYLPSIKNIIDTNFNDYLNINYLYNIKQFPKNDKGNELLSFFFHNKPIKYVYNVKTNTTFCHDFEKEKIEIQLPNIIEKYNRRITRLYDILNNYDNIVLLFCNKISDDIFYNVGEIKYLCNEDDIKSFYNFIKKKFNIKNLKIVSININKNNTKITKDIYHYYIPNCNNWTDLYNSMLKRRDIRDLFKFLNSKKNII